jgi:hypothetical protein
MGFKIEFLAQTCLPAGRWKGKSSPFFLARFGMTAGHERSELAKQIAPKKTINDILTDFLM